MTSGQIISSNRLSIIAEGHRSPSSTATRAGAGLSTGIAFPPEPGLRPPEEGMLLAECAAWGEEEEQATKLGIIPN